jgi:hypothetical protein
MDLEHTTWAVERQNANKLDIGHKHYLDFSEADQHSNTYLNKNVQKTSHLSTNVPGVNL